LAHALAKQGHADEAKAIYERLSRQSSDLPEAQEEVRFLLGGK
jgi:pentatricopeptide repeat protein